MAYLLDANVFIEAKQRYYDFNLCPGFWQWLTEANSSGKVFSVEKVGLQLAEQDDVLSEWAGRGGSALFLPPDQAVLSSLSAAVDWTRRQGTYRPAAITAFAGDADAYLVACAHAHRHTLVTHEIPSDAIKRVKIPNVCAGLKVRCLNTFDMLRRERVRFVLDS
jgi:hypothetical protein